MRFLYPFSGILSTFLLGTLLLFTGTDFLSDTALAYSSRPILSSSPSDRLLEEPPPTFEEGVQAVRQGQYSEAIAKLAPLVGEDSTTRHPTFGSAATWLGRAFAQRGNMRQARNVWLTSLQSDQRAQDDPPPADAADALLRSLSPSGLQRKTNLVSAVYYRFLEALSSPEAIRGGLTLPADTILRRRAARLALIAPDSLAAPLSTFTAARPQPKADSFTSVDSLIAAAERLQDWLRAQDPILATKGNERVVEHLRRVRKAERKYAWERRPSGLDDRGEIYVQYGPPERSTSVTYQQTSTRVIGGGLEKIPSLRRCLEALDLSINSFPAAKNEAWGYPTMDPELHFIFVRTTENGDHYRKGSAQDLLPISFRDSPSKSSPTKVFNPPTSRDDGLHGSNSIRSLQRHNLSEWKAYVGVYLSLFEQLAPIDPAYSSLISQIQGYRGKGRDGTSFMSYQLARHDFLDSRLKQKRAEAPNQQTTMLRDHPDVPVAVRTARFLNPDGTTRTEVYWRLKDDAFSLPPKWMNEVQSTGLTPSDRSIVRTTGILRSSSHSPEDRATRVDTISNAGTIRPEGKTGSFLLQGSAERHSLELEWLQYPLRNTGARAPLSRSTTRTIGPKARLSTVSSQLEMSDLRLLSAPAKGTRIPSNEEVLRERVIPYHQIEANQSVALSFEIYRLSYGREDRTRYTVEYSTEYEEDQGELLGLFGASTRRATSTASTYESGTRNPTEYILLEPDALLPSGVHSEISKPIPLTVTVRITDEITNQSVERSISFTFVPSKTGNEKK